MASARRTFSMAVVVNEEGFQAEGVTRFLLMTAVSQGNLSGERRARGRELTSCLAAHLELGLERLRLQRCELLEGGMVDIVRASSAPNAAGMQVPDCEFGGQGGEREERSARRVSFG